MKYNIQPINIEPQVKAQEPVWSDFAANTHNQVLSADEKVKQEFLAIFYKELLKKAFKAPKFGSSAEKDSLTMQYASDALINKLALQLASNKNNPSNDILPAATENTKGSR